MSLKPRLTEDMKSTMKSGDKPTLQVIRLIMAAIKQKEIDDRQSLDDPQVVAVLSKMLKQRRDSFATFQAAKRHDLANQEEFEMQVIARYLPQQLSVAQIHHEIDQAIAQTQAQGLADLGRLMAVLKPRLNGQADLTEVSKLVKQRLSG